MANGGYVDLVSVSKSLTMWRKSAVTIVDIRVAYHQLFHFITCGIFKIPKYQWSLGQVHVSVIITTEHWN